MSAQAAILLLCVLLAISCVVIFVLITKLGSVTKALASETLAHGDTTEALAKTNTRTNELETVGSEMYLELQSKAADAASRLYIMGCLEKKIAELVMHADSINAKRLAEEKKAVGVGIVELLMAVFFPATCGRKTTD